MAPSLEATTQPATNPITAHAKPEPGETPDLDLSGGEDDDSIAQDDAGQASGTESGEPNSVPLQKRRRVTRACDECRRKKIKCNGKQPCTHCQVYSYDCTYDKPSNRRRNPAPQYIEALESKLNRAETLLRRFIPDVDLNDPSLDPAVQQEFRMREQSRLQAAAIKKYAPSIASNKEGGQLSSMIDSVGQLELGEKGENDFHGSASGSVFFRRMKDHFRSVLGREHKMPNLPRIPRPAGVSHLDSPRSVASSPWAGSSTVPNIYDLPPKETALALCAESLHNATCLLRIVHIPSFYEMLDEIYGKHPDTFDVDDHRNLALAYSVMAVGCMYNVPDKISAGAMPYQAAIDEGMKYHTSARALLQDITECRDLISLQALLFMILFVQSISNLSTCYGFVGIALRSALRMGLHRDIGDASFGPIEVETRKRVFYVCRQMDTYISALLGFPLLLHEDDIDQPLPAMVNDEYITAAGILTPPPGTPSFFEAFNAHVKLMDILAKIVKHIYPVRSGPVPGSQEKASHASFMISYAKVRDMEEALQQWNEQLPITWRPSSDGPPEVIRVRNLLRFAFAHVQMVLYRPFLHYVSPKVAADKDVKRAYDCGAAGISVARNIIHLGIEMRSQVSLVGPYWFTLFTEFFAIITLIYYVLENQDKPEIKDYLADAVAGKDMISSLARRSMAADRISDALGVLFEQLPDNLKKIKSKPASKKRSAPESQSSGIISTASHSLQPSQDPRSVAGPAILPKASTSMPPTISTNDNMAAVNQGLGFDSPMFGTPDFNDSFGADFDLSSLGTTPLTPEHIAAMRQSNYLNLQQQMGGIPSMANPMHRLDTMLFASGDPMAYPSQARLDFHDPRTAYHHAGQGGMAPHQGPSQFYMPNLYDNIEGQLMGPLPPYMMQAAAQPAYDFATQMYADPMLPVQQMHIPRPHPAQSPAQSMRAPSQGSSARRRPRRQPRDPDDLLANTPWHGLWPQHAAD
ncbi:proline utilization trans-activator [Microdochium nivale]|nr:proline utilization trans-activator [Microdochium nivale]